MLNVINHADKVLISGASVLDPESGSKELRDILVVNGVIEKIGKTDTAGFDGVLVRAEGHLIVPGLFDMHAHLREPGREDQETLESGCAAAMAGGITGLCSMADTEPVCDTHQVVNFIRNKTRDELVEVHPVAAITKKRAGSEITEMAELKRAGAVALSDDESPLLNSAVMRRAMEYASMVGLPVMDHCEDTGLTHRGQMNESVMSTRLGLMPMPNTAEDVIVARDIALAELTGAHLHITKISTAAGVEMVRRAKKAGLKVTCDVTAHNLVYTDKDLVTYDNNLKVNPPMRRPVDVDALLAGVADGTIDAIVSDHSPWALEETDVEFDAAPFGMIGLETLLGLVLTRLVMPGKLSLETAIKAMTINPRKVLGLEIPVIKQGEKANLTVFHPDQQWQVDRAKLHSLSTNTPLHGVRLNGVVKCVLNRGEIAIF